MYKGEIEELNVILQNPGNLSTDDDFPMITRFRVQWETELFFLRQLRRYKGT